MIECFEELAEEEKQPIIDRRMPCFEWAQGVEIEDINEDDEKVLAIVNEEFEDDAAEHLILDMEPNHNEDEAHEMHESLVAMQDDDELVEEDILVPNGSEGLIVVPEENVVREEEKFVRTDDEMEAGNDVTSENTNKAEEVVVADVDDNPEQPAVAIE